MSYLTICICVLRRLANLLEEIGNVNEDGGKTIIFVETKKKVESITRNIRRNGWPAVCMHGDKSQQERDYVLRGEFAFFFFFLKIIVFCEITRA